MEHSPISTLPRELRDQIYALALGSTFHISITNSSMKSGYQLRLFGEGQTPHPLALTETCRLIREEALPVFFMTSRFVLDVHSLQFGPLALGMFASAIGDENQQYLRRIRIRVRQDDWYERCFCLTGYRPRCPQCKYAFMYFQQLQAWNLAHSRVEMEAHLRMKETPTYLPIKLDRLLASGWEGILSRCRNAFLKGAQEGDWKAYEELTGLKVGSWKVSGMSTALTKCSDRRSN